MFRIGEFSKIAQVSGRQLRHYDQLGLLKPEYTDPQTGYRYYTLKQLPQLNRILALKELGLSLKQIEQMLIKNISIEEIRGMLAMRKAQVEQTLIDEIARLRYIESRIEQIDRDGALENYDLVLKSVPEMHFTSIRRIFPGLFDVQLLGQEMFRQLPSKTGGSNPGNLMVIVHADVWEDDNLEMEVGFIVDSDFSRSFTLSDDLTLTTRTIHAVDTMLTIVRTGRPSLGHGNYSALGQWVDANGYEFCGAGREVYFQFPFPGQEQEAIAEIQFPVRKIENILPDIL